MDKYVYLVGSITGQDYKGATDWREKVAQELKEFDSRIVCLSPMRGGFYLKDEREIAAKYECSEFTNGLPLSEEAGIVGRDLYDVKRCNVLFVNLLGLKKVSIGSVSEIAWAYLLKFVGAEPKVIIVIMEDGGVHNHPFIRRAADYVVESVEKGTEITKIVLNY